MDATAQAELVSSGEASPAELVEAAIARSERVNPEINAVIHDLSAAARDAAEGDVPDGPFRGVPFLLKDLGATFAGEPMHMGMKVLKEAGFASPVDTTLAQRFRAAGLIEIGKTNTPELGIVATTEPAAYGATKNPWDTSRSPGGSSGGSGAAVAAGIVPMAHANDGGGSIRIPASNNGLVGLKPTRQRISEGPLVGDVMSGVTVELCVSRTMRDTARLLDAVHGPAPGDPYVAPAPLRPYADELEDESGGLRVGVLERSLIEGVEVEAPCREAVATAAKLVESLGHSIGDGSIADTLPTGEGAPDLEESFLTRWAAGQAATLTQLGMLLGRPVTEADVEKLTWDMATIGHERDGARYLLDVGLHQAMARMVAAWFESGYDLLLTPTMAEVAPKLGEIDTSQPDLAAYQRCLPSGAFTALFNLTGQPAINVPLHWTDDGVPVGVQFVAPFGREDLLVRIAAQLERAAPWTERTPPVFAAAG
ncbi:MAG TPA: amidase [Solirubrobacterales bacterium]|nr:amidase [Solirubrobacterales bacterium]